MGHPAQSYCQTDRGPAYVPVGIEKQEPKPAGLFSSGAQSVPKIIRPSGDAKR